MFDTGSLNASAMKEISNAFSNYCGMRSEHDCIREEIEKATRKPAAPLKTKCKMVVNQREGIICAETYKDGFCEATRTVMPDILDVKVVQQEGEDRAVIVYFVDNTYAKAVFTDPENYSLEHGVSICITKRLLGEHDGTSLYNKILRRALRIKSENEAVREKHRAEAEALKKKQAKMAEKRRKRQTRRAAAKREAQVSIITDAIIRAMSSINTVADDCESEG